MAAHAAPPMAPATTASGKKAHGGMASPALVTESASQPPAMAPMRYWPSAPMFQMFER